MSGNGAGKARGDVVVTGLGAVSPAGIGVEDNWTGVCSGIGTAIRCPRLAGLPTQLVCRVPEFDAKALFGTQVVRRTDRCTRLGLLAAREAVANAGLDPSTWDGARVAIVLGTANGGVGAFDAAYQQYFEQGPEWVTPLLGVTGPMNLLAGYLSVPLRAYGPNFVVNTACASGATAIGTARQLLRADLCDVVITGGAEAPLIGVLISGLAQMGASSKRQDDPGGACRPFDIARDGLVLGEGAGVLVLERADDARARGAQPRAVVAGYGASADGYHMSAPDPQGAGAERAIRAALADAGLTGDDIDHVNAHGTSTQANDLTESLAINRVYDRPVVTSTKGVTGHPLGAAGALETVYAVLALENGLVPPTANLEHQDPRIDLDVVSEKPRELAVRAVANHSFGFGGQNAVLTLTRC
jgi:3-oxoacyl-[acyl-carrier-protein] synthase II